MKKPLVSVIIPIFNVSDYLDDCILSIRIQTYEMLEIICVNDGSTDTSLDIILHHSKADNRIKIVNKENGGLSSARNAGLVIAQGDYIAFVDADDYIENTTIERCMNEINQSKADMIIFGAHVFGGGDIQHLQTLSRWLSPLRKQYIGNDITEEMMFEVECASLFVWNKFYKREVACSHLFDETIMLGEDRIYLFDIAPSLQSVMTIEDKLYYYRQKRSGSLTNTYSNVDKYLWKCRIVDIIITLWKEKNVSDRASYALMKWASEYLSKSLSCLGSDANV